MSYLPSFAEIKYLLSTKRFRVAFVVLVAIFLGWVIFSGVNKSRDFAERQIAETTLRNIQIHLRTAQIPGGEVSAADIMHFAESMDPVWLGGVHGYQGECAKGSRAQWPESSWCFDAAQKELVFYPQRAGNLRPRAASDVGNCQALRWKISRANTASSPVFEEWRVELSGRCNWRD